MHIEKLIQKLPNQAESFHLYPANPRNAAYRCGSDRKKKNHNYQNQGRGTIFGG